MASNKSNETRNVPQWLLGTVYDWGYREPEPVAEKAPVIDFATRSRERAVAAEKKSRAA